MNRTQIIGITMFVVGAATLATYQKYNSTFNEYGQYLTIHWSICHLEWLGIQSKSRT